MKPYQNYDNISISKYIIIYLLFLFISSVCPLYAQTDTTQTDSEQIYLFAEYLYSDKDYFRAITEYKRYLFISPTGAKADSAIYKIGLSYNKRKLFAPAINSFKILIENYPQSKLKDKSIFLIGQSYFENGQYDASIKSLEELSKYDNDYTANAYLLMGWSYLKQREWKKSALAFENLSKQDKDVRLKNISDKLSNYALQGEKLPHRYSVISGVLSTLIPGAGQIYCGRYGDGLFSLLVVGSTAGATYISYRNDNKTGALIVGGFSSVFYLGNIYGGILASRIHNNEVQQEHINKIEQEMRLDKWLVE